MPDHTDFAITIFGDGEAGAFHGFIDGVILVISGQFLDSLNLGQSGFSIYFFIFFKNDKVTD